MVDLSLYVLGEKLCVRFMRYRGAFPARDYLEGTTPEIRARFLALATYMSDHASLPDGTHGHFLKGRFSKIFEFKPKAGRVLGFFFERNCYLTNGAAKKKAKDQINDYERAWTMHDDFFQRLETARRKPRSK